MEKKEGVRWVNKGGGDGWKSKSTSLKPWARMRPVVPDDMEIRSRSLLLETKVSKATIPAPIMITLKGAFAGDDMFTEEVCGRRFQGKKQKEQNGTTIFSPVSIVENLQCRIVLPFFTDMLGACLGVDFSRKLCISPV